MRKLAGLLCFSLVVMLGACGDDGNKPHENCSTPGDEDGNGLADCADPACASDPSCTGAVCGNGVMEAGEDCDDGNTTAGDGCSPTCKLEACGNGVVDPGEGCDDGNQTNGDGCDNNCTITACGNGVMTTGETCDDGNTVDGDGCDSNCTMTACGNGATSTGETCDDGNTTNADGCSATCQLEPTEIEPNDDGTPDQGNNGTAQDDVDATAIANADANGAFDATLGEVHILGQLSPAGDEDVFKISNSTGMPQIARLDVYDLTVAGFGNPCDSANGVDTVLQVYDATATSIALNDDRNGATDRCSGLEILIPPGQAVYPAVSFYDDATVLATPGYALKVVFTPVVCGDGTVSLGEECDDGNTANGDGCDATCHIEGVTTEVEPNDTTADADASTVQVTSSTDIRGSMSASGDVDLFKLTVTASTVVHLEPLTQLSPEDCVGGTADVAVLDSTGTEITSVAGEGGINGCSALTVPLDPGTYYAQVSNNTVGATYFLRVTYQTADGAETEAASTMGTNDTQATAETLFGTAATTNAWVSGDHTLSADSDWYAITVPNNARIRAEVIEGSRATETCESDGIDSKLTLYDQTGATLVSNDDAGRGFCSLIDGRGASPTDPAATNTSGMTQTYYLEVNKSDFASAAGGQFIYRLSVEIQ